MADCKQVVEELKAKVSEYESLLEKLLGETQTSIGIIKSDVFIEKGNSYYRVAKGSDELVATFEKTLLFAEADLKIGVEVLLIKDVIIGVLPEKLLVAKLKNEFPLISWDEIGGLKSQLQKIKESVQMPLQNAKLMKEYGLEPIKGVLLWGPPGCGKTLIAKAIASEILKSDTANDDAFHYIKGAEMLSKYVGETEQRIVTMFKQARLYGKKTGTRAVIFIDEAEAILPARGSRVSSDVDKTIVPTFLSEMDGFDDNSPFILLSTNLPNSLDEAIIREGRIDLKIEIARPTIDDAEEIFKVHLKKVKTLGSIDEMAKCGAQELFSNKHLANRISGALMQTCVKMATQKAVLRKIETKDKKGGVVSEDLIFSINNLN